VRSVVPFGFIFYAAILIPIVFAVRAKPLGSRPYR
jgi:hypothetical protein